MAEQTIAQVGGWPFNAPSDTDQPEYTARDARQLVTATSVPALPSRPLGTRSGVRPGTGTVVWVAGGTVSVGTHSGVVDAGLASATGPYSYAVTAPVAWTLDAPHATYPRVDLVGVRIDDDDEADGTGQRRAVVAYLPGDPSVSPAVPTTPDRWMVLARVSVPASGTGNPAVTEVWDALPSPVWTVRTAADLPALAAHLAGSQTPAMAQVADTGTLMTLDDGSWSDVAAPRRFVQIASAAASTTTANAWKNVATGNTTVGQATGGEFEYDTAAGAVKVVRTGIFVISMTASITPAANTTRAGVGLSLNEGAVSSSLQQVYQCPDATPVSFAATWTRALSAGSRVSPMVYSQGAGTGSVQSYLLTIARISD
ncbi:MAG: hypothetical protein FWH11_01200 [Micrococcales bacterium]|nr:hypothetical protein [Micrococcales bacterium]